MICPNCLANNKNNATVCQNCGYSLIEEELDEAVKEEQEEEQQIEDESEAETPAEINQTKPRLRILKNSLKRMNKKP